MYTRLKSTLILVTSINLLCQMSASVAQTAQAALRSGDYKLIRYTDRPVELYDSSNEFYELNDLASQEPEIVRALYEKFLIGNSLMKERDGCLNVKSKI